MSREMRLLTWDACQFTDQPRGWEHYIKTLARAWRSRAREFAGLGALDSAQESRERADFLLADLNRIEEWRSLIEQARNVGPQYFKGEQQAARQRLVKKLAAAERKWEQEVARACKAFN